MLSDSVSTVDGSLLGKRKGNKEGESADGVKAGGRKGRKESVIGRGGWECRV